MADNELVGLQHIAQLCGVSRATLDRRRSELEKRGAYKREGQWHVPVAALIEVGLKPDASRDITDASPTRHTQQADTSSERIRELEMQLRVAQAEADKWRAIAEERQHGLEDFRRSHRLLEMRSRDSVPTEPDGVVDASETAGAETPVRADSAPDSFFGRVWGRRRG